MDSKALQYVKKLGPLIGLILLFVIISVMNDSFLEFSNLRNLLRQVSINAIIAFGMTSSSLLAVSTYPLVLSLPSLVQ